MSFFTPATEEVIGLRTLLEENGMLEQFDIWFSEIKNKECDKVFSILQEFTDPLGFIDIPTTELKEIITERLQ